MRRFLDTVNNIASSDSTGRNTNLEGDFPRPIRAVGSNPSDAHMMDCKMGGHDRTRPSLADALSCTIQTPR